MTNVGSIIMDWRNKRQINEVVNAENEAYRKNEQ
jgi:hypothetical protein